jgi:ATP-binding cassette, subfamily B (MDR/TAP), member 1
MSVMLMVTSISGVTAPLAAAARAAGAATVFYTIIDAPSPETSGLKAPDVSATEDIVLDHVNFAYPTRPNIKVLDDLSLTFPAGKITAIVGPSGSGKSTIVGLLERWYELGTGVEDRENQASPNFHSVCPLCAFFSMRCPSNSPQTGPISGTITTAGHPLREIDLKWWRTQIGLVQQEPFLFNNSIYRNVEFGLVGTQWEDTDLETKKKLVKQACKEAFAEEFIERLPEVCRFLFLFINLHLSRLCLCGFENPRAQ